MRKCRHALMQLHQRRGDALLRDIHAEEDGEHDEAAKSDEHSVDGTVEVDRQGVSAVIHPVCQGIVVGLYAGNEAGQFLVDQDQGRFGALQVAILALVDGLLGEPLHFVETDKNFIDRLLCRGNEIFRMGQSLLGFAEIAAARRNRLEGVAAGIEIQHQACLQHGSERGSTRARSFARRGGLMIEEGAVGPIRLVEFAGDQQQTDKGNDAEKQDHGKYLGFDFQVPEHGGPLENAVPYSE